MDTRDNSGLIWIVGAVGIYLAVKAMNASANVGASSWDANVPGTVPPMNLDPLAGAVGALASGSSASSSGSSSTPYTGGSVTVTPIPEPSLDSKVAAFLAMIRQYESGNDYSVINGGAHFTDFSHHPDVIIPPGTSTAAGAYQIIYSTWVQYSDQYNLTDFSPTSQDQAAYWILNDTGAIDALNVDDIATALADASTQWASLPGSPSGQPQHTVADATNLYFSLLG